ncbi:MAG: amidohydrolase family protein, partial [Planctomycetaceae bacterium]|nr:amidohydrolase family protein [Planctomycetaceae bacterium]
MSGLARCLLLCSLLFLVPTNLFPAELNQQVSLLLVNGNLVTMDAEQPRAEAIAIDGDQIVALGTTAEIRALAGPKTTVMDLQGRLTIPGFIEGHGHFLSLGRLKLQLDLTKAQSWQEIVQQVEAETKRHKPGTWILGRGWHQEKWRKPPEHAVGGYPRHESLSQVSPDHPILLVHASGHASIANAKAMELAGVSADTPDPVGGKVLRDDKGQPIGVFRETAQDLIHRAHHQATDSQSPTEHEAQQRTALKSAAQECIAKGITSFHDAGSSFADVDFFKEQAQAGQLPVRLWVMLRASNTEYRKNLADYRLVDAGNSFLTVRAIKCMA